MGYGNYGGYGGYGASPYGPIAGSSFLPPYPYPGMMPGGLEHDEFSSKHGKEKKAKGLEGFFKGIYNGAVNTIKGIFSVQGLAMTAATAGLVWATGGAALIPLAALGVGIGGFQLVKGIAQGDAEGVGEGVFTTAASLLGLKFTPKTVNLAGKSYTLTGEGEKLGIVGRMKAAWGGSKYKSADGEMNVWQMGLAKLKSRFQPKSAAEKVDSYNATSWKTHDDVKKVHTLKMGQKEFRVAYDKAWKEAQNPQTTDVSSKKKHWWAPDKEPKLRPKTELERKQDLNRLEQLKEQAGLPKQKTIGDYIADDEAAKGKIRSLKIERDLKQLANASDAEIDAINREIKIHEDHRKSLLENLQNKVGRSQEKRKAFIEDVQKEKGAIDPENWKYNPQIKEVQTPKPVNPEQQPPKPLNAEQEALQESSRKFEEALEVKEKDNPAFHEAGRERDLQRTFQQFNSGIEQAQTSSKRPRRNSISN